MKTAIPFLKPVQDIIGRKRSLFGELIRRYVLEL